MPIISAPFKAPVPKDSAYDRLVSAFLAHGRETPALLQENLLNSPHCPRIHALHALMLVLLGRGELLPAAQAAAARGKALLDGTQSAAKAYCEAAEQASNGQWHQAIDALERVLSLQPDDAMAAKLSHALRFMLGDKTGMLRSIERILARLSPAFPHYGFLQGCKAFALEENGFYAAAERLGHEAVARESRDAWGLHAVCHVHEMTGRFDDGIRWIEQTETRFRACNNFGGHLFWHLALFKLEKGAIGDVFALYDREIRREHTDDFRDLSNAASLLARLELDGHSVGNRWDELAHKAESRVQDRTLVFADLHYMLALMGAGKLEAAQQMVAPITGESAQTDVSNALGATMAQGLVDFAAGRPKAAFNALFSTRNQRVRLGGSDAQRDIFEQILIESALRAGENEIANRLLAERLAMRGNRNAFASSRLARIFGATKQASTGALALKATFAFSGALA